MDVKSKTKSRTETRSWGGETVSLESVIDDSGLILKSKDPLSGKWLDYRYDGLGRVTQISFPMSDTGPPIPIKKSDEQTLSNNKAPDEPRKKASH